MPSLCDVPLDLVLAVCGDLRLCDAWALAVALGIVIRPSRRISRIEWTISAREASPAQREYFFRAGERKFPEMPTQGIILLPDTEVNGLWNTTCQFVQDLEDTGEVQLVKWIYGSSFCDGACSCCVFFRNNLMDELTQLYALNTPHCLVLFGEDMGDARFKRVLLQRACEQNSYVVLARSLRITPDEYRMGYRTLRPSSSSSSGHIPADLTADCTVDFTAEFVAQVEKRWEEFTEGNSEGNTKGNPGGNTKGKTI